MEEKNNLQKRFTMDAVLVYVKVWFKFSFWPITLLAAACYFGIMPVKLGVAIGGIVLLFTTGGALINFICYVGNIDIPKIL